MSTADEPRRGAAIPTIPVICDACRTQGNAGEEGFTGITDILSFEPVPRRTQVNNWTAEVQRAFIAALAITGSARRAGKAIGRHEIGAEKLRKARGGKEFSDAWDAALEIYRDREMARLGDQMAELSNLSLEQAQRMDLNPGEREEGEERSELQEAQQRIRGRLLRARRLYLLAISQNEKRRAAWETLMGPVDWKKAVALQPQDNEPYQVRIVNPDILAAAEGGCLPDVVGSGRDRISEYKDALEEAKEIGDSEPDDDDAVDDGTFAPKTRRFFDKDGEGEEGGDEEAGQ